MGKSSLAYVGIGPRRQCKTSDEEGRNSYAIYVDMPEKQRTKWQLSWKGFPGRWHAIWETLRVEGQWVVFENWETRGMFERDWGLIGERCHQEERPKRMTMQI